MNFSFMTPMPYSGCECGLPGALPMLSGMPLPLQYVPLVVVATTYSSLLDIQPEIYDALHTNSKPVVALESTIITHGMPFPHNLNTAIQVEEIVRNQVCHGECLFCAILFVL